MDDYVLNDIRLLAPSPSHAKDEERREENSGLGTTPRPADDPGRRSHLKMAKNIDNLKNKVNESAIIRYARTGLKSRESFCKARDMS